jgi:hypothetical protein
MVDLGLISITFTSVIAACWAWETRKANNRIYKLERSLADMRQHLGDSAIP